MCETFNKPQVLHTGKIFYTIQTEIPAVEKFHTHSFDRGTKFKLRFMF